MTKVEFRESGLVVKKMKKINLAPENVDYCKSADYQDRLGDLPDCLIHHILSFVETKDAIRTSVLSKRWRHLWASVTCLNFSSKSFARLVEFKKFVLWVLSHRDSSQVKVLIYSRFGVDYATDQYLLNKVIEYAASHGVEEIRINLRAKTCGSPPVEIPLALFACQSLKMLEFKDCHPTNVSFPFGCKSLETLHLERFSMHPAAANFSNPFASLAELFGFTTLTTLHLNSFSMCYTGIDSLDPFGNCVNLKTLHLSEMSFQSDLNPKDFVISAPQLKNLSLMCNRFKCKIVVASPQLTNFSYLYSTRCSFLEFTLPSMDGLTIDIHELHDQLEKSPHKKRRDTLHGLVNMLRGHRNSEAVKLSFCTVAVTCGTAVSLKPESLSFSKLKLLNFGVGSTYKIFINNLDHIAAYFRNCSQHADFEVVTI
ncbi:PREDICTED: putative FBD-associated F-box protein At5g22720 [Lupinus angustifolius]|uniref:putative FBD-associated F-box protein At5g22720 n=1 Tax=Lupinus angustifolius TaxID=3871 RepID=UPI00092E4398|nr:PREDICTED: putative FBD-associated F-box protein At5g22720 [Lupinus angustifolius]XP_019455785.1 PREDICTED: putative FBD-associated F-box protein At5g22720 [Lupinus angustifolius]XP_019455786.1 PREDICTED: putative FBD-associated F-box protein At5g22720 [Lupinus angustifolius]